VTKAKPIGPARQKPITIEAAEIIPLSYGTDDKPPRRRYFALLKITTSDGVVGWGEATDCYGHSHPMTVKALFDERIKWMIRGADALKPEVLLAEVRRVAHQQLGGRGAFITELVSAIEIALWDIKGKIFGRSVSEMLGAYRNRIQIYAACPPLHHLAPEQYADISRELRERGVEAVKIRTGNNLAWDRQFARDMRAVLGPDIRLLVDGKFNYRTDSAISLAATLEELGVICFEEPVADTDLGEMARLAAATTVPISYGEHCFTIHDFRDLITHRAARILNPDACACGGIAEARNVAVLAQAFGLSVMPHCGGLSAVGMAANVHAAAVMPVFDLFEFDSRGHQPLRDEIVTDPLFSIPRIVDGCIEVPSGPGLGIEIDESALQRYPYRLDTEIAATFPLYGTPHI
jgi:D-galactarolactone cycloisomerase